MYIISIHNQVTHKMTVERSTSGQRTLVEGKSRTFMNRVYDPQVSVVLKKVLSKTLTKLVLFYIDTSLLWCRVKRPNRWINCLTSVIPWRPSHVKLILCRHEDRPVGEKGRDTRLKFKKSRSNVRNLMGHIMTILLNDVIKIQNPKKCTFYR